MELIKRPIYTKWLTDFKEKPVAKILAGIRGAGKSSILRMYIEELKASGVDEGRIVFVDLEDENNSYLLDEDALYDYIKSRISPDGEWYVFLNEVGKVNGFERILNSLLVKGNVDLYAAISSGEAIEAGLTTRSVGRDVVKEVLPLSFSEYCSFFGEGTRRELFERYAAIGGFPGSASMDGDEAKIYVKRIYRDVLGSEVLKKNSCSGLEVAEGILRILARDLGKATSAKKVADCLSEEGSHVSYNTVSGYIDALRNCRLIREIPRWDTERKILMLTGVKYYFTDPGLYALFCDERDGALLENMVCLELERRGCRVAACKTKGTQGTFLATWGGEARRYVLVAPSLDDGVLEKAVDSLLDIRDNYPKYIVTMDEWFTKNHEGIITVNALDFLSGQEI